MKKQLIIIGNTSNAKLAHYYFSKDSEYDVAAFSVDKKFIVKKQFCNLPVIPLEMLEQKYPCSKYDAFVAIGYSNMNKLRENIYNKLKIKGYKLPNYISTKCSFLSEETIGDNNLILEDNTIQPFVKIGSNNVLWSGNHIGHDVIIKDHCFITSQVVISGFTTIENNCFIGVNATLRDDITIDQFSLIGAGVTLMHSTEKESVYLASKPFKMNKKSTELKIS
jgi:sugar O-acyltransferase (sialic acid O-acetyltransferase NeuD family)